MNVDVAKFKYDDFLLNNFKEIQQKLRKTPTLKQKKQKEN